MSELRTQDEPRETGRRPDGLGPRRERRPAPPSTRPGASGGAPGRAAGRYGVAIGLAVVATLLVAPCQVAQAQQSVTVLGSWLVSVSSSDLQGGAGTDLVASRESTTGQVTVAVGGTTGSSDAWRVDVGRSDTVWPPGLGLWLRRTSDGTGAGSISGGLGYLEATATATTFFSGSGDRDGVGVQLKIDGLSVVIAPGVKSTSVIYTVVDI